MTDHRPGHTPQWGHGLDYITKPNRQNAHPCFECGEETTGQHHVVPYSKGGRRVVPMCTSCHGKVHGLQMDHTELVKAGMEKSRARGVRFGRKKVIDGHKAYDIREMRKGKKPVAYNKIAEKLGISVGAVHKWCKEQGI